MITHTQAGVEIQYGKPWRFPKLGNCPWCNGTGMYCTIAYNGILNTGYIPCRYCGATGLKP